ncbi:MAG TPA: condensation domain-containing protein, partial [Blastocatellia bacterium]|nr:condensation domain-containing protein [Blastocatellia bacterium]
FDVALALREIFEKPTVRELTAGIESARRSGAGPEAPPIGAASRDEALPLSFAQQGLWFLDQWEPNNSFYNLPAAIRLKGSLNINALENTLSEIVRRHEVLRTRIVTENGKPVQVIEQPGELKLDLVDLGGLPRDLRDEETLRLANEEANRPFQLSEGPLLRIRLIRLSNEEHVVLLTLHHIVSDAWSIGVLIDEVGVLYSAYVEGRESPLPDLQIQYADYAAWQREWLQGAALEEHLKYWKKHLAGSPPMLNLPLDRPRPARQSFKGTRQSFMLSRALTDELKAFSRREEVTLFMTLLAAFNTLLYRHTGEVDMVVGTAIAGRNRIETEGLIGFFVNILPMRTDLSANPRFKDLLKQVREAALGAYDHQDLPYEKMVEELQPDRQMDHKPIFQIAFGLQNAPREVLEIPGLSLSSIRLEHEVVRFDLTLWASEAAEGLQTHWTYSTDLFDDGTISQMYKRFEKLLRGIIAEPDARLNALDIIPEDERREQATQATARQEIGYKKFLTAKPKLIRVE